MAVLLQSQSCLLDGRTSHLDYFSHCDMPSWAWLIVSLILALPSGTCRPCHSFPPTMYQSNSRNLSDLFYCITSCPSVLPSMAVRWQSQTPSVLSVRINVRSRDWKSILQNTFILFYFINYCSSTVSPFSHHHFSLPHPPPPLTLSSTPLWLCPWVLYT